MRELFEACIEAKDSLIICQINHASAAYKHPYVQAGACLLKPHSGTRAFQALMDEPNAEAKVDEEGAAEARQGDSVAHARGAVSGAVQDQVGHKQHDAPGACL